MGVLLLLRIALSRAYGFKSNINKEVGDNLSIITLLPESLITCKAFKEEYTRAPNMGYFESNYL